MKLIEKVKLGALAVGGAVLPNPQKPWGYEGNYAPGAGNIPVYKGGTIEIIESEDLEALISWVPVEMGGKEILIADRNLLTRISWNQLNEQGLIFGREVMLDGKCYNLRVLTGGDKSKNGDCEQGGFPNDNEWDRFITNRAKISGLPFPNDADLDEYVSEESFEGDHNQFWNWAYALSWCQEEHHEFGAGRVLRGYGSARYWAYYPSSTRHVPFGWRPALEVLNSGPVISGESNKNTKEVSVTETFCENRKMLAQIINEELQKLKDETNARKQTELINNLHQLCRVGKTLSEFERG